MTSQHPAPFRHTRKEFLARLRAGLNKGTFTLADMERASGIDRTSIRGVLNGKDCMVSTLERLSRAFGGRVEVCNPC